MNRTLDYSLEHKPTFQEWVVDRYGVSCIEMHDNFKHTGSNKEYQKAMAYLRNKYHEDMKRREMLIASNPFQNKEEN